MIRRSRKPEGPEGPVGLTSGYPGCAPPDPRRGLRASTRCEGLDVQLRGSRGSRRGPSGLLRGALGTLESYLLKKNVKDVTDNDPFMTVNRLDVRQDGLDIRQDGARVDLLRVELTRNALGTTSRLILAGSIWVDLGGRRPKRRDPTPGRSHPG